MRTTIAVLAVAATVAASCVVPSALAGGTKAAKAAKAASAPTGDLRAYMHGIGAITDAQGVTTVFFSSSGLPPRGAGRDRNWTHDVYIARWTPQQPKLDRPRVFISRPEAQEPVSVAQNDAGRVMVSFEDGWNTPNEVSQRYGVYTSDLKDVKPYPNDVLSGGHSGHVAAVGSRFVVFYSNDWVNGGGVDNLGTGNGVYVKTYDADGALLQAIDVAPRVREWWPMIAASPTRALLVWQQYVSGETWARLKVATLDPSTGALSEPRVIADRLLYYTYAAAYVPSIDRFVVVATSDKGKGFAQLIDASGQTTATLDCMPASVREAGIAVIGERAFTPSQDGRLLHLKLTPASIELAGTQPSPIAWTYTGSVGLVRSPTQLHWVATSPKGLQEADFDLKAGNAVKAPDAKDLCKG
ncbi:hypothetical protein [Paraburkholderia hospita]|jgi:hypothetical protein|uniref:Uncharacterized protein n=1 Tax=Paraburkholderia hospita TaxID=169430 RepID=A0ABN0FL12_9BURK|nr:hypothetical protein [Paraburkholderia hospita]AXE98331.1 hypothetical protein CUJ88_07490 [Paraburkholderia hospita]EIM99399.1 hypothetical protein WQE_19079 [Paraburkholderia hospita]OUL73627.1 hypothetical protein CA602_40555 [Paraburkholderia hospita]OUL84945.1 hypothetical protein CA601_25210 [Paraburkholderia hospita]SKC90773.1 hypothetical protein SAMN06266956_4650 [Paraburkholderia hospita]